MTTLTLSDCIRATPARTLTAVALELVRRMRSTCDRDQAARAAAELSDRALADIGLTRTVLVHEA